MAGVSAGTVDRVLHKRGKVSPASKEAVEKVLKKVGYKYNIHTSAISVRKTFNIAITLPNVNPGEYWDYIKKGIDKAIYEYSDIDLKCNFHFYNQFQPESCVKAFADVLSAQPDAVIIGPTFIEETQHLCKELDKAEIPYVFVDSQIEGTAPVATFTTDQHTCGMLAAKLLYMSVPKDSTVAILNIEREGNRHANNSIARKEGFNAYMESIGQTDMVRYSSYVIDSHDRAKDKIESLLKDNPDLKGISVLNSRGHVVSELLQELARNDIRLISFDLTMKNIRELENGHITALLCQRPEQQGFNAIKTLLNHLLFKNIEVGSRHVMPIDILFKENLKHYTELTNL